MCTILRTMRIESETHDSACNGTILNIFIYTDIPHSNGIIVGEEA
jgi:hypothetical protein